MIYGNAPMSHIIDGKATHAINLVVEIDGKQISIAADNSCGGMPKLSRVSILPNCQDPDTKHTDEILGVTADDLFKEMVKAYGITKTMQLIGEAFLPGPPESEVSDD